MLGLRYLRFPPTTYVIEYRDGRVRREGPGLAFLHFVPRSTVVAVPVGSTDVPFMFGEATSDYQAVTVQGHLAYRVAEPRRLASLLDFSRKGDGWASEDPARLPTRVAQAAQAAARAEVQRRPLRACLAEADAIAEAVLRLLRADPALVGLGLEVLGVSVLAVRPAPETARALEAQAREGLLREADDAVYGRRANAVEQESRIREAELATEMAVQARQREIEESRLAGQIALEENRRQLVRAEAENTRARAEAQAFAADAVLGPLRTLDPRVLQVLAVGSSDPRSLVALAFQEIAANAARVGTLNISPDLLDSLLRRKPEE